MVQPNRLRNETSPNTIRVRVSDHAAAKPAPATPSPSVSRRSSARRPLASSRSWLYGGLGLAALGVPLFFDGSLRVVEIGIGMISVGLGIALASTLMQVGRREIAASRRSASSAVANVILLPHTVGYWVVALGLIGFGVALFGIAAEL
jgi:hypothetical protein